MEPLRLDARVGQGLQQLLAGDDIAAAVPAHVENQPIARQQVEDADELGHEGVGIRHVERADLDAAQLAVRRVHGAKTEDLGHRADLLRSSTTSHRCPPARAYSTRTLRGGETL